MFPIVDVHCHLVASEFDTDRDDVIQNAKKAGVGAIVVVPEFRNEFEATLQLAKRYPDVVAPCLGIHPVQGTPPDEQRSVNDQDVGDALEVIECHADDIVGIGEVGLDFTPRFCKSDEAKEVQRRILTKQVELAKKLDLPLNVHSRSAGRPTIKLLKDLGAKHVLLHAFDGKPSVAMEGVEAGFYFSIPPSIIRSEQKKKLVERLPIENILLETDSPALGPVKQERNVPSNITVSCEYIASVKNLDIDTVRRITTENALKLFPKLKRFVHL